MVQGGGLTAQRRIIARWSNPLSLLLVLCWWRLLPLMPHEKGAALAGVLLVGTGWADHRNPTAVRIRRAIERAGASNHVGTNGLGSPVGPVLGAASRSPIHRFRKRSALLRSGPRTRAVPPEGVLTVGVVGASPPGVEAVPRGLDKGSSGKLFQGRGPGDDLPGRGHQAI